MQHTMIQSFTRRRHHEGHGDGSVPSVPSGEDYFQAIKAYRATFPDSAQVLAQTPDPAVREMLLHFQKLGLDSPFSRFDQQKPHCTFGIAGVCCRNCMMGPCKITPKSPRGTCGADADLIVARNLLRHMAAAVAGHGARAREAMLALRAAANGEIPIPLSGQTKILAAAKAFGLSLPEHPDSNISLNYLAKELAEILLEDLARTVPGEPRTLKAFAAPERMRCWQELDLLPISAYHETFEAMHRTGTGTDGDWRNIMKQFERCGLAFSWSSVLGNSIASDCLFGLPTRNTVRVNLGALEPGSVNIAVHGHAPLLVSEIVRRGQEPDFVAQAESIGAKGVRFYGICCSGLSAMYRYGNVIPLSNAVGAELVLGTGALDLWVADVQDIFPSILEVADCVKTKVITTNDATRLPGAEHLGFDHHHSNLSQVTELADQILQKALESHAARKEIPVFIPQYEITAEVGFSAEGLTEHFGGSLLPVAEALLSGQIKGIVNLVGCNNPRVVFEKAVAEAADLLLSQDILILTNGCASFPLLKLGFCRPDAAKRAGSGLQAFLHEHGDLPPVWHMGECIDNARASAVFKATAAAAGREMKEMPFAFLSPEWSNEKGIGAALSFRLLGINSYHCVYPPVQGSPAVMDYVLTGGLERFGSKMVVNPDHILLTKQLIQDLRAYL